MMRAPQVPLGVWRPGRPEETRSPPVPVPLPQSGPDSMAETFFQVTNSLALAAWTHYLVFDMVVGSWIARDSVKLGTPWLLRTAALAPGPCRGG